MAREAIVYKNVSVSVHGFNGLVFNDICIFYDW